MPFVREGEGDGKSEVGGKGERVGKVEVAEIGVREVGLDVGLCLEKDGEGGVGTCDGVEA